MKQLNPVEKLLFGLNKSAYEYHEEHKPKITSISFEEQQDLVTLEELDKLMLEAIAPDLKWEDMNREQRRRAKKLLKQYKTQFSIK